MFFCDSCRAKNKWPGIVARSYGRCEVCFRHTSCYDVPSKYLPNATKQQWSTHDVALLASQIAELVEQYDLKTEFQTANLAVDFVFSLLAHNDKEHYDTDVMGN